MRREFNESIALNWIESKIVVDRFQSIFKSRAGGKTRRTFLKAMTADRVQPASFTSILPVFSPFKRPISARGAF